MWVGQTRSLPLTPTQPGSMTTLVPSALRERAGRGRHFASLRDLLHTNAAISPFSTSCISLTGLIFSPLGMLSIYNFILARQASGQEVWIPRRPLWRRFVFCLQ